MEMFLSIYLLQFWPSRESKNQRSYSEVSKVAKNPQLLIRFIKPPHQTVIHIILLPICKKLHHVYGSMIKARRQLPFMYQTSIEGIKSVLKECWSIYTKDSHNNNKDITWFHKIAALKLAKECNEALFRLTAEGPSVMCVKLLEERLARIEAERDQSII